MERILVACFGSLKKGFYNHRALGEVDYLGNTTVYGVMYLHGSYPRLYHVVNDDYDSPFRLPLEKTHEVEVYSVDQAHYEGVRSMELGAGYEEEEIDTPYGKAKIYFNPHTVFSPSIDKWIPAYTHELLKH